MPTPIPETEPLTLRAGDSARWARTLADYPASAGWALSYVLLSASARIEIASAADGDAHAVTLPAATTAGYAPGAYTWAAVVTKGTDRYTVGSGRVEILPDLAAETTLAHDGRSHARKALEAIEAWIESADPSVARRKIADREIQFIPIAELLALRDRYRREVRAEDAAAGIRPNRGRILLRF